MLDTNASIFVRERLKGAPLIGASLHPRCRMSVIVPVYKEPVFRVVNLLLSLARQRNIFPGEVEVLCVINQGPDDGSEMWKKAKQMNQLVLDLPFWRNRDGFGAHVRFPSEVIDACMEIKEVLPVYAIDYVTSGAGFIGEVLNRGLAEAAIRYDRVGKNGIMNVIGADSVADDPDYLYKAIHCFTQDERVVAAHAGVRMVFDPDTPNEAERLLLAEKMEQFLRTRRARILQRYIDGLDTKLMPQDAFINVLSRTSEAVSWGGYPDWKQNEDSVFGYRAKRYAKEKSRLIKNATQDFSITVALRDSDRTGASIKPTLDALSETAISLSDYERLEQLVAATNQGRDLIDVLEEPANILWDDFPEA